MKSLLIAGTGYIGEEVLRRASGYDFHGIGLSRHKGQLIDSLGQQRKIHDCDFTDTIALQTFTESLSQQPSTILLSASSGRGGPEAYRKVFLTGLENLLNFFPKAHFIFTSSTSVYHQTDGSNVDENSSTKPIRETSQILLEAEKMILKHQGTVARLAGIYGPDRCMTLKKLLAETATIEGDGTRLLNQIHRDDAATALLHLASQPHNSCSEIYNIADSSPLPQLEVYQALCDKLNKKIPPRGEKKTDGKRAWTNKAISNQKLLNSGWKPLYPSFREAVDSIESITSAPS